MENTAIGIINIMARGGAWNLMLIWKDGLFLIEGGNLVNGLPDQWRVSG
jgi:hypothetical protein